VVISFLLLKVREESNLSPNCIKLGVQGRPIKGKILKIERKEISECKSENLSGR
jgi:hypothetical protein